MLPKCQVQEYFGDATGTQLPDFAFWSVVIFCSGLQLLQRNGFLMRGEDYMYLWV